MTGRFPSVTGIGPFQIATKTQSFCLRVSGGLLLRRREIGLSCVGLIGLQKLGGNISHVKTISTKDNVPRQLAMQQAGGNFPIYIVE